MARDVNIFIAPLKESEVSSVKKAVLRIVFEKDGKLEFALAGEPEFFAFQSNMINANKAAVKKYFKALTTEEANNTKDRPVFKISVKKEYEISGSETINDHKSSLNDILYS